MERIYGVKSGYAEEIVSLIHQPMSDAELLEKLEKYHENDIAEALELLTKEERKNLYRILGADRTSEIFSYLDDAEVYLKELGIEYAAKIVESMDSDDAVDVLEDVDQEFQEKLVSLMDADSSRDIQLIRSYDDEEIGSRMTTNFIMISHSLSVKQAMKELIRQAEENDNIDTIYVCNKDDTFYGAIDLKDLITAREGTDLKSLISEAYPFVRDHEKLSDCLEKIKDYAEDSIPVLNEENHILGIITSQDIIESVDVVMGEDYARLAGLFADEDLQESLADSM